jgi:hypothetical protein
MGGIDLDPAASPVAQQRVRAAASYTREKSVVVPCITRAIRWAR